MSKRKRLWQWSNKTAKKQTVIKILSEDDALYNVATKTFHLHLLCVSTIIYQPNIHQAYKTLLYKLDKARYLLTTPQAGADLVDWQTICPYSLYTTLDGNNRAHIGPLQLKHTVSVVWYLQVLACSQYMVQAPKRQK